MPNLNNVMSRTDWTMLAEQKLALLEAISTLTSELSEPLTGLLHWIDAIQDAAEEAGFPVVFLSDPEA